MKHLSYNYERNKCEDILYKLLGDKGEVSLKEKMWIQTTYGGYEFTACKVKASSCLLTVNYELYNDDEGIHCSHRMLTNSQLKELTRLVSNSILK